MSLTFDLKISIDSIFFKFLAYKIANHKNKFTLANLSLRKV